MLKPIAGLIMYAASRDWTRKLARLALKPFKMDRDVAVMTDEHIVYVNSVDRYIAAQLWKRSALSGFEAELYRKTVKEGMTVLEIGANIGFFTLLFSRLAGASGRVFAFEPDPDNFRLLEKNVQANGCRNTVCARKAVSERTGTEKLYVCEEHRGDHRLFDSGDGRPCVEVETVAVDDFLPAGPVHFIKMDIQGAELMALKGMEKTVKRCSPLAMLCEFSPALLRKAGADPAEFLKRLEELGFSLKYLDEEKRAAAPAAADELLAKCPGDAYLNLFLEK